VSCYKILLTENQELRLERLEMALKLQGLREQFKDRDWVSVDEIEFALDCKPVKLPWD
jgi:hypothetical protein